MQPTYFVQHPDGSFSEADPQPIPPFDVYETLAYGLRILYKLAGEVIPDQFSPEKEIPRLVEIIRRSEPVEWACNECSVAWAPGPIQCPVCGMFDTDLKHA